MSGFKRFVSLLSSSLMALGGVSASRSVDVLKRKNAGKIGVHLNLLNGSKENGRDGGKKNKEVVDDDKKAEIKGDVKGLRSDSGVKNIDRVLSGVPDDVAKSGLVSYVEKCKEKNGEDLIRWENIWRSVFIPGSYAGNSKQVIRARGAIEAFYNDAEALDLINKFVSDPDNFSNKAKIDDLIGKLSARSWCEYVGSWIAFFVVYFVAGGFTGFGGSSLALDILKSCLIALLADIASRPINYDAHKVWGKKETFEKILQSFKK